MSWDLSAQGWDDLGASAGLAAGMARAACCACGPMLWRHAPLYAYHMLIVSLPVACRLWAALRRRSEERRDASDRRRLTRP